MKGVWLECAEMKDNVILDFRYLSTLRKFQLK